MSEHSKIPITDATWNPVTGCIKLSRGCDHCYAERFAERFRGVPDHPYARGFDLVLRPERLGQPEAWKKPRIIFVNSMSDLFMKEIPEEYVARVFDVMEQADWHIYQVLTKRSSLMRRFINARYGDGRAPAHIWLGASIEDRSVLGRIEQLRTTRAATRYLCFEPLLGPVGKIDLTGFSWAIAGGETGAGARPMEADWVREIRDQCVEAGVAFFFKQWGGSRSKLKGDALDGRQWRQFPALPAKQPDSREVKTPPQPL
jgi:protein gp37